MFKTITREYLLNAISANKTTSEIQEEIGCKSKNTIYNHLKKYGLQLPQPDYIIKPDTKFGQLTVLSNCGSDRKGNRLYLCQCLCGKQTTVNQYSLVSGNSKTCGCSFRRQGEDSTSYKGFKLISGAFWGNIKNNAKNRKIDFDLSIEFAWHLFISQNGKCALTGKQITLGDKSKQTASLDRIDSSIGYIPNNVQWIHKDVNRMKNHFSQDYFIETCRLVARHSVIGADAIHSCE